MFEKDSEVNPKITLMQLINWGITINLLNLLSLLLLTFCFYYFLPIIFSSFSYSFIQCFLFFILLSMFIDWYKTDGSLNWIIPSSLNLVSLFIAGFCL